VRGRGAFAKLKFESGVHRVQRVPDTETQGRIHTSAATVAVLPEVEEVDVEIKSDDLRIETMRAQGAGGQHVNKTESAIRITHIPTGIVVMMQDSRSQHKNRASAMNILRSRIYDAERQRIDAARSAERREKVGSGDRSERIRTYNFPQGRVTDHRINLTLYKLPQVIAGEALGELIDDIGGGTFTGRPVRAVQVGGPLGAYFPRALFDTPFDYEAFAERVGLIGHGGIVVFDDSVDMAKQARFAMEFCAIESCGKCTPCRIGSTRGVETIDKIRAGERVPENIAVVEDLCNTMKFGSLCALGGFTPYPVLSALKHFKEDFGPVPTRLQAAE